MEKSNEFDKNFRAEPRNLLAQNVTTGIDPLDVCLSRKIIQNTLQVFQHAVPAEGKPVTNQKSSGNGKSSQMPDLLFLG